MNQIVIVVKGGIVQEVYANPQSSVLVADCTKETENEISITSRFAQPLEAMKDPLAAFCWVLCAEGLEGP